uniref:Integrase catalytic domain-containing protein n=1 Tax=Nicotiana tabacum TaxID=4097 RepID=A0A1S3Y188_TOBAC|nr:PREDICTED: uncharacterized protein LOC107771088 [Nicotiana tabacum]
MVKDCLDYAQRCKACQFHANFIHQPPEVLNPTVASWLFEAWGWDVVGPFPKSSNGHLYILAATDYFSKWVEAQCNSSMYYDAANGLAEAFNKTLYNLLKKVVSKSKRDWHERMEEALWAYRNTYRTLTQATPYSLIYGVEAVLPLERQISSLRLANQEGLTDEENARLRLEELEALDEKKLEAQQSLECYQARLSRSFNKRVRLRSFQVGDQVLVVKRPIITYHRSGGKFSANWDGPYIVQEVYSSGAYKIVDLEGDKEDRNSTSETCQLLGKLLISWNSKKQGLVALSTMEDEYIAIGQYCAQDFFVALKDKPIAHGRVVDLDDMEALNFKNTWPDNFEISFDQEKHCIAECPFDFLPNQLGPNDVSFETRVIVATTLLPRTGSFSTFSQRDTFLVYCLVTKLKIKLSY